jgi:hypothetical protein
VTEESEIVREVRERAARIEARYHHDLHEYCEHLRAEEEKHPERLVDQIAIIRSKPLSELAR